VVSGDVVRESGGLSVLSGNGWLDWVAVMYYSFNSREKYNDMREVREGRSCVGRSLLLGYRPFRCLFSLLEGGGEPV
jgi:hypothetical protein